MFHYQTRRMLRIDNTQLRGEVARLQAAVVEKDTRLGREASRSVDLQMDRQALADRYWQQRSTAQFRFGLQMALGLIMVLVCVGAGTYLAWHTHQAIWLRVAGCAACALVALGLVPIVRYIGRLDETPETVTLPSGETIAVSPAVVAETHLIMAQMAS